MFLGQAFKSIHNKLTLAVMATSFRMASGLTTSINLKNPDLLRAPSITFHRESLQVFDPAATIEEVKSGSAVIALVEVMDKVDAKKAIEKSSNALKKWKSHTTATERSFLLSRWSELIKENTNDIGKSICHKIDVLEILMNIFITR